MLLSEVWEHAFSRMSIRLPTHQNLSSKQKSTMHRWCLAVRDSIIMYMVNRWVFMSVHKPIVSITKNPLISLSPRLQRLLSRLQKYNVNITYVPAKYTHVADTLSRAYLKEQPADADLSNNMEIMVHNLIANRPMTPEKLAQVKSATAQNEDLQVLTKVVKNGWLFIKTNCLL